jgi:gamma-glutamylcysteine synthetase
MGVVIAEPGLELRRLDSAYRNAWKRFCAEVGAWQALLSNAVNGAAMEEARDRVESAEASYREHRNNLTDRMLLNSANACTLRVLPRSAPSTHNVSIAKNGSNEALERHQIQLNHYRLNSTLSLFPKPIAVG